MITVGYGGMDIEEKESQDCDKQMCIPLGIRNETSRLGMVQGDK